MAFTENRIFRVTLLIATLIVFYLWLQNFSDDEETAAATRSEATEEEILPSSTQLTESVTPGPVVRGGPNAAGSGPLLSESETPGAEGVLEVTVLPGDTLEAIAVRYQTTVTSIQAANPGKTTANLQAGETLRIVGASTDGETGVNPSTDREPGESVLYRVEPGDLLSTIAEKYGVSAQAIIDANPGMDPNVLLVAQEITIPPIGSGLEGETVARTPGESTAYVIEEGDYLSAIAVKFDVTEQAILSANPELAGNPSNLLVGQTIVIPPSE